MTGVQTCALPIFKNAIRAARDAVAHEMNRHIAAALDEMDSAAGEKKPGLSRKLWDRFKSKIESIGDTPDASDGDEERRRSGR